MIRFLKQQQARSKLTYKVRARLGHQWNPDEIGPRVPNHEAVLYNHKGEVVGGTMSYVGFVFDRDLGDVVRDPNGKVLSGTSEGGWRPVPEVVEVPRRAEYLQAIAHGDLWPGDEETAQLADALARATNLPRVKYDTAYGGELKELNDWLADREAEKKAQALPKSEVKKTQAPPAGKDGG